MTCFWNWDNNIYLLYSHSPRFTHDTNFLHVLVQLDYTLPFTQISLNLFIFLSLSVFTLNLRVIHRAVVNSLIKFLYLQIFVFFIEVLISTPQVRVLQLSPSVCYCFLENFFVYTLIFGSVCLSIDCKIATKRGRQETVHKILTLTFTPLLYIYVSNYTVYCSIHFPRETFLLELFMTLYRIRISTEKNGFAFPVFVSFSNSHTYTLLYSCTRRRLLFLSFLFFYPKSPLTEIWFYLRV